MNDLDAVKHLSISVPTFGKVYWARPVSQVDLKAISELTTSKTLESLTAPEEELLVQAAYELAVQADTTPEEGLSVLLADALRSILQKWRGTTQGDQQALKLTARNALGKAIATTFGELDHLIQPTAPIQPSAQPPSTNPPAAPANQPVAPQGQPPAAPAKPGI